MRFASCGHCGLRLRIQTDASGTHAEAVEELAQRQDAMAEELGRIRLGQEIDRLDREWAEERERHLVSGRDGGRRMEPMDARTARMLQRLCLPIVGIMGLVMVGTGLPWWVLLLLPLLYLQACWQIRRLAAAGEPFHEARERYERRRAELVAQREAAERDGSPA